jgi:hypothetical protein
MMMMMMMRKAIRQEAIINQNMLGWKEVNNNWNIPYFKPAK